MVAVRQVANELVAVLAERSQQALQACEVLNELWRDPDSRLQLVAAADSGLAAHLAGQDGEREQKEAIDTASEYSMASSVQSVRSQRSQASSLSVVSVLSTSSRTSSAMSLQSSSAFSIKGLEHSLLSRGDASAEAKRGSSRLYESLTRSLVQ